jgi:hypothetical protein
MKELEHCKWTKGPPKQLMLIKMTREKFQSFVNCTFKEFDEDQGKEWATGFSIESVGQVAIIQYEHYSDILEVIVEPDLDPVMGKQKILAEFRLGEEWVDNI